MTQQTSVLAAQPSGASFVTSKHVWRADAVFNLLFGDLLFFAPNAVIGFMGMPGGAAIYLRIFGIAFSLYGLWQFWVARTGSVSKTSYLLAAADMAIIAVGLLAALLAGVPFNGIGSVIVVLLSVSAVGMMGLWYAASRQVQ